MSVYVDAAREGWYGLNISHMVADTLEELHGMADRLSLRMVWFKVAPLGVPHYCIAESRRKMAVDLGATELDKDAMQKFVAQWRKDNFMEAGS